jgi:hypothetical protein
MAHFAELDDQNNVLNVVVVNNSDIDNFPFPESESVGIAYLQSVFGDGLIWKQTSYNSNFRRQYAEIGGSYYEPLDVFVSPKPFPSWVFQTSDATWQAPIPKPIAPQNYLVAWNEQYLEWDIVLNPGAI